ncbi:MAG: Uncharacterised protein [Rhodospirillaceae bacterium]|nr:MAG: Uncharacterised protein [Rhodospirillaceae bacterium]
MNSKRVKLAGSVVESSTTAITSSTRIDAAPYQETNATKISTSARAKVSTRPDVPGACRGALSHRAIPAATSASQKNRRVACCWSK